MSGTSLMVFSEQFLYESRNMHKIQKLFLFNANRCLFRGSGWILLSVLLLVLSNILFQGKYKKNCGFSDWSIWADFCTQPRTSLQVMT